MDLDIKDGTTEDEALEVARNAQLTQRWMQEISAAKKREKTFRKDGYDVVKIYEGDKGDQTPFNILFSNTETMAPALYNSIPRPVVQRRFKDPDPLGKVCSEVGMRVLQYLLDDGLMDSQSYDDLLKSAVLEALVPGRGIVRFRYHAEIETVPAGEGFEPMERVVREGVVGETIPWDQFYHGYAKRWEDVPWIAFEERMTREELLKSFGEIGRKVTVNEPDSDSDGDEDSPRKQDKNSNIKTALVYQIWDKETRMVYFIAPGYQEAPLKAVEDPLGLSGFFPCPAPLSFLHRVSGLLPQQVYKLYENQAKELNKITTRIDRLVSALKVRGMYDSTVEGLSRVLEAEDNTLVPAENVAALQGQGGSLEKAIWLMPLDKVAATLQQLYAQRTQVKQVIYEITGIADIMRGSTQASETLGAQELKNQWGSLRLKRGQKSVATFARDCLRLMLEISMTKCSAETLQKMTGLPYPTAAMKAQAQQLAQQAQMAGQQPPPQVVQTLSQPSWEDILQLMQNDLLRSYRIDIETNSTVDAEATEDKQNIAELLNAIGQFLNGVSPLIQEGVLPFDIAKTMLLTIVRRFRFGPELEDYLAQMAAPQPKQNPQDAANAQKAQMEQQRGQLELQMKQLELSQQQQQAQAAMQLSQQNMELARTEHAMKLQELQRKSEYEQASHRSKMEMVVVQTAAQLRVARQQQANANRSGVTKK